MFLTLNVYLQIVNFLICGGDLSPLLFDAGNVHGKGQTL